MEQLEADESKGTLKVQDKGLILVKRRYTKAHTFGNYLDVRAEEFGD